MPDIATALQNAIKDWEPAPQAAPSSVPSTTFKPTNNVSRETFNAILDNPGISNHALVDRLTAQGFNKSSVSSLAAQMVRQGFVSRDAHGCLRALVSEYQPLKSKATIRRTEAEKAKAEAYARRIATRKANAALRKQAPQAPQAPQAVPTPAPQAAPAPLASVDVILNSISVVQARELYLRLKELFG